MKKTLLSLAIASSALFIHEQANAQGCVAVRQMGGINAMSASSSYNLAKGEFQVGANYRYFHSWRHFVGTEEQPQRETLGNAVNIYQHAVDFNVSYGLSSRLQLNATLPFVNSERSQTLTLTADAASKKLTRYSVSAGGLADIRFGANYWLIKPENAHKGNIMIGAGIKLATGSYTATDDALQTDGTKKSAVMDQAIQPGDGGVGFSLEFQGFRQIHRNIYGFANAYYLFSPQESNGSFKSAPKAGLEGYNVYASPDQYFARAGFMSAVGKHQNFAFSLAGRFEGIPAYDAFGGQVAYRRPGYVVAIEPGVTYRKGQHTFSLFVPYNFIKNRIQSAADIADQNLQNSKITDPTKYVHVQGDAAFADYSISLGYSYRIAKKAKVPTWKVN
ncbi:hypothetical protein VB264_09525 [Arcicella aquatica]|uniref:Major outer membrane protein n=1 Tax=Arcicella aquatica TaxID=217141 RepID=A0ABU5QLU2_9BACT|nr:hypothetical protein [Arcicella aquatica]MEA5258023.1 hypothetical protein [Arcicella aquatica]